MMSKVKFDFSESDIYVLKNDYEAERVALVNAEATASRCLELLDEVRQLLDDIYAEDIVSSGDLGKVYEKIVREIGG